MTQSLEAAAQAVVNARAVDVDDAIIELEAALNALPADAEPVAWISETATCSSHDGGKRAMGTWSSVKYRDFTTPLYASPPSPDRTQAQRAKYQAFCDDCGLQEHVLVPQGDNTNYTDLVCQLCFGATCRYDGRPAHVAAQGEAVALTPGEIFDMGFEWAVQVTHGHVYDARDVARTMTMHIFDGLVVNPNALEEHPLSNPDKAKVSAKREIMRAINARVALVPIAALPSEQERSAPERVGERDLLGGCLKGFRLLRKMLATAKMPAGVVVTEAWIEEIESAIRQGDAASPVYTGADAKDAARYRWLLENFATQMPGAYVSWRFDLPSKYSGLSPNDVEAAIDAAMSDEAGKV